MSQLNSRIIILAVLFQLIVSAKAADVPAWDGPAFEVDPAMLIEAATAEEAPDDANIFILLEENRYDFDELHRYVTTRRLLYRVLTDQGADGWSETIVVWRPWYQERPVIRARVITADGTEHQLDPETIAEAPVGDDSSKVYRDTRLLKAPLPAVTKGAVVEEEYKIVSQRPFFEGGVLVSTTLNRNQPLGRARLTVTAPTQLPIKYQTRLLDELKPDRTETGDRVRLVFEAGPFDAQEAYVPGLPGDIVSDPLITVATGESWGSVARTYYEVVEKQLAGADLGSITEGIATDGRPRDEVIADLLVRLHERVRYTGVEFRDASYVPRTPAVTLERRYGDCKDKSALMVAMLRAAGIDARLVLLNVAPGYDVEPELPGFGRFDHAIVYVPGPEPLWLDPTDEFSRVGELPLVDQKRLALIIDPATSNLTRTPASTSADNRVEETREFFLADIGKARIVETTNSWGSFANGYRSGYSSIEEDDLEEQLESYIHDAYLSTELGEIDWEDTPGPAAPFRLRLEVNDAGRAVADQTQALAAIRLEGLVSRLPGEFTTVDDEDQDEDKKQEREHDYEFFQPFTYEWRYRIHPPAGFRLRELPEASERTLGKASFKTEFSQEGDVVVGTLRFETGDRRITADEFRAMREGVQEIRTSDPIMIWFDQTGEEHLNAGRIREAMVEFRRLIEATPEKALPHTRLARALLAAGLGEAARQQARRAVDVEPDSSLAHQTLGWILQHDMVGRRFREGFDRSGSIQAYERGLELAPEDNAVQADLAILLEHGEDGVRYSPTADLEQAIGHYRAILEREKIAAYQQNLAVALLYAGKIEELQEYLEELGPPASMAVLDVTVRALLEGAEAAVRHAAQTIPADEQRRNTLLSAGQTLAFTRHYPEAAALMTAGARGASNSAQVLAVASLYRHVKRYEEVELPADDPTSVVTRSVMVLAASDWYDAAARLSTSYSAPDLVDPDLIQATKRQMRLNLAALRQSGMPVDVAVDISLAAINHRTDGDENTGYRVKTDISVGNQQQSLTTIVMREDGEYRILEAITPQSTTMAHIGLEALERLEKGDRDGAVTLLEWAAEFRPRPAAVEDPLMVPLISRFWDGPDTDTDQLRYAAAALLTDTKIYVPKAISLFREGLKRARKRDRIDFQVALVVSSALFNDFDGALEYAEPVSKAFPESDSAFMLLTGALASAGRWDDVDREVAKRLEKDPDNEQILQTVASLEMQRGRYQQVRERIRRLLERGRATSGDLNNYAWSALLDDTLDQEAIDAAERAARQTQSSAAGILHTLAAVYAADERPVEARELILHVMDLEGSVEPGANEWYVLGLIAEAYGEVDAARTMYERVERPKSETAVPVSSYFLAQQRLKALAE